MFLSGWFDDDRKPGETVATAPRPLAEPVAGPEPAAAVNEAAAAAAPAPEASEPARPSLWPWVGVPIPLPGELEELTERFEERAAIAEFDGGLERAEAEELAAREVFRAETACKYCGAAIWFAEVEADLVPDAKRFAEWKERKPSTRGRIVPCDLSGWPHECKRKGKTDEPKT